MLARIAAWIERGQQVARCTCKELGANPKRFCATTLHTVYSGAESVTLHPDGNSIRDQSDREIETINAGTLSRSYWRDRLVVEER